MSVESSAPLARWRINSEIYSVAVSRDGTRLASGSDDRLVRVWDVGTRTLVFVPLVGHTAGVRSVAFSPDNTRIVSGSYDKTILIWDARTGALVGNPLWGHSGAVYSVAFSPDSNSIISSSEDCTIRMWNALTCTLIGKPLRGHTDHILSVAFSPDNTCIVSGSNHCSRWDAHTGALIGRPLLGHTKKVYSVAFSHDSTRIVSGSEDCTVRMWDARFGTPIGDPLMGHTNAVCSVAFSHDSTRIVSGSHDCSIRIWDASAGTLIRELLKGHNFRIWSVTFSHDSTCIFSGSRDGTIGVWEAPQSIPSFDIVTSKMSTQELFECLVKHGCTDLTSSVDAEHSSSAVMASGGFGDIRRIELDDGSFVALKTLRLHILRTGGNKSVKRAVREVYLWSRLRHPNIQELLGITVFQGTLGMVSPWREKGNLQAYILAHPDAPRHSMCIQMASGVSYLHSVEMVHGDLKAVNVLVADDGTLKISDFDYAILADSTLQFSATTRPGGGTLRWMAPELFEPEGETGEQNKSAVIRSKQTDVYALGMTMLEIATGTVPYSEYRTDIGIYQAIRMKQPPKRPEALSGIDKRLTQMWELLLRCWDHDPSARPNASSVLGLLKSFAT